MAQFTHFSTANNVQGNIDNNSIDINNNIFEEIFDFGRITPINQYINHRSIYFEVITYQFFFKSLGISISL